MPSFWTQFGASAEEVACKWLTRQGFTIRDRNFRRPWGELDIVAQKGTTLHFVEVKASLKPAHGFEPYVRAGSTKMRKVHRTARSWLAQYHPGEEIEWQLDVISVIMNQSTPVIEYFEHASL